MKRKNKTKIWADPLAPVNGNLCLYVPSRHFGVSCRKTCPECINETYIQALDAEWMMPNANFAAFSPLKTGNCSCSAVYAHGLVGYIQLKELLVEVTL